MRGLIFGLLCLVSFCTNAQQQFTVYFDTDIDVPQQKYVDEVKYWISKNPDAVVTAVDGYADYRGTGEHNAGLSERRANTVLKLLTDYGAIL